MTTSALDDDTYTVRLTKYGIELHVRESTYACTVAGRAA